MLTWIMENMATIIISVVLIIMVAAVITGMAHSKKKGKSSCGCGCAGCAMNGACHPGKARHEAAGDSGFCGKNSMEDKKRGI